MISIFVVLAFYREVEGGRKQLLDALALIMSHASEDIEAVDYNERTSNINEPDERELLLSRLEAGGDIERRPKVLESGERGPLLSLYQGPQDANESSAPVLQSSNARGSALNNGDSVEDFCTNMGTETRTREECEQVVDFECNPIVKIRTEIEQRCRTRVSQDCQVVFKDQPERKCEATEREHCHTAYKVVEEEHYKEVCHTDIQNVCEEQIRVPVEVPYPVAVPYPAETAYPQTVPSPPSKAPEYPPYEQYSATPQMNTDSSPLNIAPADTSRIPSPQVSEVYLVVSESDQTKTQQSRVPKSLGETRDHPVFAYNPTPAPYTSPSSGSIKKLEKVQRRRRRHVARLGPTGPSSFPDLHVDVAPSKNHSTHLKSTFVTELPAPYGCRTIATKTCSKVPIKVSHKVPYEECQRVPDVKCHLELKQVGQLDCVPVVNEECEDVAKEVPYKDEEEECEEVIYDECREVRTLPKAQRT